MGLSHDPTYHAKEEDDNCVGMHRVLDVAWVMADSDPESLVVDHHDEDNYLDNTSLSRGILFFK